MIPQVVAMDLPLKVVPLLVVNFFRGHDFLEDFFKKGLIGAKS